ncbi:MAG TPA: SPOR domain-containing protein [Candidatus Sulfotelmatobacter sp.]|nr:SPOR domain-containing protein [Candidatus Sulfotelmatobacter sp.]
MASSEDTEITLGTGKLLVLFFGLVGVCALFFALGYSLGRKSEPPLMAASPATALPASPSNTKGSSPAPSTPMTFYKNVEQKEANPELTPAADSKTDNAPAASDAASAPLVNAPDPATVLPTSGYFVQVAAVSKQEDADSLVDALKKKQYSAFVAAQSGSDKLFHVQVGPYSDVKEAETMRTKLIGDGYSPILKK